VIEIFGELPTKIGLSDRLQTFEGASRFIAPDDSSHKQPSNVSVIDVTI